MRRVLLSLLLLVALPLSARSFKADDGTLLHYDVIGKGSPVVLLSGGPGFSPDYLRPIAEKLAAKHSFILFHQRGTGRSTLATYDGGTMELQKVVADLEALRRTLKVKKLTIVGHSWGGIVSMMYAGAHPNRIARLVLVDSGGPTLQALGKFQANLNARLSDDDKAAVAAWSAPERMKNEHKRAVYELTKAKTAAYFADRTKAHLLADNLTPDSFNDAAFWALMAQISPAFDLRAPLKSFDAPVLIIHGKEDPLETADEVHETFPGSRLEIIENAGHFPWLEQPSAFYAILGRFLALR